jgi:hypothetical protein
VISIHPIMQIGNLYNFKALRQFKGRCVIGIVSILFNGRVRGCMTDDGILYSRFWRWMRDVDPSRPQEEREALKIQALSVLLNSINSGEITSLDGINSPVSQRIKAHHNSNFFEMNTNWIGSSQNWICPCCSRSKFQISRSGNKGQILAKLVVHHDHMGRQ